jgi:hypothetical protein
MRRKSFLQLFVGNNGCLQEAIHASLDFTMHKVVGDKLLELIKGHDFSRDYMDRNANVLEVILQRCAKKEILKIDSHETAIKCQNNTIEQSFDGWQISSLGTGTAGVVNLITANRVPDPTWLCFLRMISTNHWQVCSFASIWHLVGMYEEDSVSSCWHVTIRSKSLCKSSEFFCICLNPQSFIATLAQFIIFSHSTCVGIDGCAV